jgi:hypothetical protein
MDKEKYVQKKFFENRFETKIFKISLNTLLNNIFNVFKETIILPFNSVNNNLKI